MDVILKWRSCKGVVIAWRDAYCKNREIVINATNNKLTQCTLRDMILTHAHAKKDSGQT